MMIVSLLTFTMSRARLNAQGQFDGVVLGSVLPRYFQDHWATMSGSGGGHFTLYRADGAVLAQYPETQQGQDGFPARASCSQQGTKSLMGCW